ncbi:ZIP family metal transporter [Demequina activiva]|uniref:ZIP family zinc transporter n=1 Tax=Demequina activiva TaxID=1582364 RepID=A0A919Q4A8_9MICO|nr:ZIP family zinc transporter [Demequina activiva]GIG54233.1 ZIP family zinc transporter [Demequina activiva]
MIVGTAALASLVGIGALLVGAAIAWRWDVSKRVTAGVMAFGAGVLIATLALELVTEAHEAGGVWPVVIGFAGGALLYVGGDALVTRLAQRHRHPAQVPSGSRNATAKRGGDSPGGGAPIAVGALLDGIPEAIVIGLAAASGGFPVAIVAAIGLSNVPEGLAGTVPLKRSGRGAGFVFGLWAGITALAVLATVIAVLFLQGAPGATIAVIQSVAAGALLAMVCNAMIPEAFEQDHWATGLLATAGFLVAFALGELL